MTSHPEPQDAVPHLPSGTDKKTPGTCTADQPPGVGVGPITTSKPADEADCSRDPSPDADDESAVLVAGPEAQKRSDK